MSTLILIHGRRQHGREPAELRREWIAGLNAGLTKARLETVRPEEAVLPYYGDLLQRKTLEAVEWGTDIDLEALLPIDPHMPEEIQRLESDLLRSMAERAAPDAAEEEGLREAILWVPGARRLIKLIADATKVDDELVEGFLTDVAVYLLFARDAVLATVRAAIDRTEGDVVIVAHSLGSLVALDLLDEAAIRERTALLVTAGSPLGLDAVYRNLRTPGALHPGVEWISAWDPDDFGALGHPLTPLYGEPLVDVRVDNPSDEIHSIERYLGHEPVARRIGARLAA
jgi:hypothetical protein